MLVLDGDGRDAHGLAFAPDATALDVSNHAYRESVTAWNLAERTAARLAIVGEPVCPPFGFLPGGRWAFGRLAFGPPPTGNRARLFDLATGAQAVSNFENQSPAVAPDGTGLVTLGLSHHDPDRPVTSYVRLYGWELAADGPRYAWHRDLPQGEYVSTVVWPRPDRIAVAERPASFPGWRATLRDAASGAPDVALPGPHPPIFQQLLAGPNGLLVGRYGTGLYVWDTTDPQRPPRVVVGKPKDVMHPPAACFHPSGEYLLLANDGPSVLAFETRTWAVARKWTWKLGSLRVVAVSPDGTLAAASGPRGRIVVWDLDI